MAKQVANRNTVSDKLCECGCGLNTKLNNAGNPQRYIKNHSGVPWGQLYVCRKGHTVPRVKGGCLICKKLNAERFRANNPDVFKEYNRRYEHNKRMNDPVIVEFVRRSDPLVAKLEALILNEGATQGEKEAAYRALERKNLLPKGKGLQRLRISIISGGMANTQLAMKSLPV